jgi:hypothetical protein
MNLTGFKDEVFNLNVGKIVADTNNHLEEWEIDEDKWEAHVLPFWDNWEVKYEANIDPATKNSRTAEEKTKAREALEPIMHKWIEYLRGNENVTDEQERDMGIFEESHSSRPTPTTDKIPELTVELDVIRRVTVGFKSKGEKSKAKPTGVSHIEVAWDIRDTPPKRVDELKNVELFTRTPFILNDFEEEDRGKSVYMAARWVMNADVSGYGPWSEITFAIIP